MAKLEKILKWAIFQNEIIREDIYNTVANTNFEEIVCALMEVIIQNSHACFTRPVRLTYRPVIPGE